MKMNAIEIIFIFFLTELVHSQICVLPGTCSNNTSNTNTIDIRIVTPGLLPTLSPTIATGNCPPGLVPCLGAVVPQCGLTYVTPISQVDGVSTAGAHPWQAYIMNQTSYTGSGVLIDQYHVLTAAHKVNLNVNSPSNIQLYFGLWDPAVTTGVQNRTAERIFIHPNFNPVNLFNDIAIIRLNAPVPLGTSPTINIACLPNQGSTANYIGKRCTVAGWGQTRFNSFTAPVRPQRQVTVPIVSYTTCRNSFSAANLLGIRVDNFLDRTGEICAGGEINRDACTSDGGAPLMCTESNGRKVVVGLVIWGKGCGTANVYGVYTNIANYRTWIDTTIGPFNVG